MPFRYSLEQNYPNPFNPNTKIRYVLERNSFVEITIYDLLGNIIKKLVSNQKNIGSHYIAWDGTNDQGKRFHWEYTLCRIDADGYIQTKDALAEVRIPNTISSKS